MGQSESYELTLSANKQWIRVDPAGILIHTNNVAYVQLGLAEEGDDNKLRRITLRLCDNSSRSDGPRGSYDARPITTITSRPMSLEAATRFVHGLTGGFPHNDDKDS